MVSSLCDRHSPTRVLHGFRMALRHHALEHLVLMNFLQKDDVFVGVEDGVLTIKIPVGPPAAPEEAVEIQLR
jgi:hypothetical protein